jgi:MerR family redox-sensitive transcriptional activator SoxR
VVTVPELLTIGEVAERARVATSTVRYYERRGLLRADARQSGQRRYRTETLRRLVFIGMLQDAGLALDEIHGILHARTVKEWKAIAAQRLGVLDQQIAQLQHAREVLTAALLCRLTIPPPIARSWVRRSTVASIKLRALDPLEDLISVPRVARRCGARNGGRHHRGP